MRSLLRPDRSRSVLVACTLAASALLGSGVAQANTCRPWHIELSAQFTESVYDEDGNLRYAEATGSGYASYIEEMTVLGTYVVTGGTGRFRGATGRAALSSRPLAPNGFTVVADGTLCF